MKELGTHTQLGIFHIHIYPGNAPQWEVILPDHRVVKSGKASSQCQAKTDALAAAILAGATGEPEKLDWRPVG